MGNRVDNADAEIKREMPKVIELLEKKTEDLNEIINQLSTKLNQIKPNCPIPLDNLKCSSVENSIKSPLVERLYSVLKIVNNVIDVVNKDINDIEI